MSTSPIELGRQGVSLVATPPTAPGRTRATTLLDALRERVTTTPGRLVLIALAVVASAVLFGVVATGAEHSRAQAAQAARSQTEPLLVQAATLYTALSDANATVTTTFLKGGLEPPGLRAHYLNDLRIASDSLATLTREVAVPAGARSAIRTVTEQLPVYSGLVEAARADNRQGFPVGAAYLRRASTLLTGTILPNADRVYATEAQRLNADYGTGTGTGTLVALIVAIVAALGLLIGAQVYVAGLSHRTLNLGMLVATLVLAAVSIWAVIGFIGEQNALARARRASDAVEVLSATQVMLSRAQSDQSLTLVNRGSDQTDPIDFKRVTRILGGLLSEANTLAQVPQSSMLNDLQAYEAQTNRVSALQLKGQLPEAIGQSGVAGATARQLNASLAAQIANAQDRFAVAASDATSSMSGLVFAIPLLTAIAALLALAGLRPRLEEYR